MMIFISFLLAAGGAFATSKCPALLEQSQKVWRDAEAEYVELRKHTSRVQAQTEANTRINALLGRSLTDVLARVAPWLLTVPAPEIASIARDLERDFPQTSALPYVEPQVRPFVEELKALIQLMNSTTRARIEPLATIVGGGIFPSPRHTITLYGEYRAGAGEHPFVITDQVWMNVLAENKQLFREAVRAHAKFAARRPEADRVLDLTVDRWRDEGPRAQQAFDQMRRLTPHREDHDPKFWRECETFDLSVTHAARQVIDGTFFSMPLPIGDYGLRLNRHLRRTAQVITLLLEKYWTDELATLQGEARSLIERETSRGRSVTGRTLLGVTPPERRMGETEPLLRVLVEGIYSIGQALNFLLIDDVGSDVRAAMRDVLTPRADRANSLMVEFTAALRMGLLGPSTLNGQRFRHPLHWQDGHLRLNPKLTAELRGRLAEGRLARSAYDWRRALPCPVASSTACGQSVTGLQYAADLFLRVSEQMEY